MKRGAHFSFGGVVFSTIVSFVVVYLITFIFIIVYLVANSDYRPITDDPLFGRYLLAVLIISICIATFGEIKSVVRSRSAEKEKAERMSEISRLALDKDFVASYASEGAEGDAARARVAELLQGADGWPNETTRLVFKQAEDSRNAEKVSRRNASLNQKLRELVFGDSFEESFFSPDPLTRSPCEQKLKDLLHELGPAVDDETKSAIDDAFERRSSSDDEERERDEHVELLNERLRTLASESNYQKALQRRDAAGLNAILAQAREILEELGEDSDDGARKVVSRMASLHELLEENVRLEDVSRKAIEETVSLEQRLRKASTEKEGAEEELRKVVERSRAADEERRKAVEQTRAAEQIIQEVAREKEGAEEELRRVVERSKAMEGELREMRGISGMTILTSDELKDEMAKLDSMDGWEFESYCAELLKSANYQKVRVTSGSGDQGIDVIATKDGVRYGIQCKHYGSPVGNKAVQEAHSGKSHYKLHVAIVLTNSTFSPSAVDLAKSTGVVLWGRRELVELVKRYLTSR